MLEPLALPLDYPVYCERGALHWLGVVLERVAPAHRVAIISDTVVAPFHASRVFAQVATRLPAERVKLFTIPTGEQQKTREQWGALTDALLAWGAGRDSTVIALGGGVIGDLAGFVAATYMRGVPVIQLPTTLLAMVDASVGGKTAIDTPHGKNLVGAFHHPAAVIIDPDLLTTLPRHILRGGLPEMLKHGIIADVSYFNDLLQALPLIHTQGAAAPELPRLIANSVRIKANVVADDVREGGLRQILNFGHTIAHAIEKVLNFSLPHGDAVAVGIVVEGRIAELAGLAPAGTSGAIAEAVRGAGLPVRLPDGASASAVLAETHGDKKARGGAARYALPRSIGEMEPAEGRWSLPVPDELVRLALE